MAALERTLLNFGVDGYGVDQAYLRYRRDVLAWHPEIVILGMIDDDLRRTMCVYGFLCFSGFGIPFSKPRLVLTDHGLAPLNLPLPAPDSLFAKRSIADLPFIEFDVAFDPRAWQWRFYHHSYAIRFALSRYHPWTMARPPVTREVMKSLNAEVVRAFVKLAREHGSTPIVAFFPSNPDPAWAASRAPNVADEVLAAKGIRYFDLTGCVEAVPAPDRFVALHYSSRSVLNSGLVLLGLLPAVASAQEATTVTGKVTAAVGGAPLAGATVRIPTLRMGATADAEGLVALRLQRPGEVHAVLRPQRGDPATAAMRVGFVPDRGGRDLLEQLVEHGGGRAAERRGAPADDYIAFNAS